MPLTLVTGRANSGKTGIVYEVARQAGAGGSALVLLPTVPDVRRAQREFARERATGIRCAQIGQFLASRWERRGDGRRIVTDIQRVVLVRRALAASWPGGEPAPGVVRILSELVKRAAEEGVTRCGATKDPTAKALLAGADTYRRDLRRHGLIEVGEAQRLLADRPPDGPVIVHRFVDLTPAQEHVVTSWADSGADVWLTLTHDADVAATEAAGALVSRLEARGCAKVGCTETPDGPEELARLASDLFGSPRVRAGGGAVTLSIARGDEAESRALAGTVADAVEHGTPPENIAVIYRDTARHHRWVARALAEAGVRADIDVRVRFSETPLGRALLWLWDGTPRPGVAADIIPETMGVSGLNEEIAAFCRTPYSGATPDQADQADLWLRSLAAEDYPALKGRSLPGPVRAIMGGAYGLRVHAERAAPAQWKHLADLMMTAAYGSETPVPGPEAALDGAAHAAILQAADDLSALADATPEDLIDALRDETVSVGGEEHQGRVQVIGIERARARRFDLVILAGLTAAEIPRRGTGDRLAGDAARETARCLGLREPEDDSARERLLFYLAATRARERLVLSRQESDDDGRAVRASVFWDELLDLYRDPRDGDAEPIPTTRHSLADMDVAVDEHVRPPARGMKPVAGVDERVFTVSEIEAYLGCPYRWFLDRDVGCRPLDTEVGPREAGTLAHAAIATFYRLREERHESCRILPETEIPEQLSALVEEAIALARAAAPRPADSIERDRLLRAERGVRALLVRDAGFLPGWMPRHHEWPFGLDGDPPHDMGGFLLKGKVDRVESGPEGLVVIDYKLSSVTHLAHFEERGLVQLQLYAIVVRERLREPVVGGLYRSITKGDDRGFHLLGLVSPGLKSTEALDAEAIDELLEQAREAARGAVEGMRAGRIEPRPDPKRCPYCEWRSVCDGGTG